LRPYDFRHFFVTAALDAGADLKALSEIVGSSPHVTRECHRRVVKAVPPLPDPDDDSSQNKNRNNVISLKQAKKRRT